MTGITLVVLSYNSSRTLQHCLDSARGIVDSILVVDSHSTDDSVETARRKGARVLQRSFSNYADQRNWAAQQIEPGAAEQGAVSALQVPVQPADDVPLQAAQQALGRARHLRAFRMGTSGAGSAASTSDSTASAVTSSVSAS